MSILQANGLALRFAQEQSLFRAVDFDINAGDRIAVIGPNGAGKSSLLRILAGELAPDRGTIVRRRGLAHAYFAQSAAADAGDQIWAWPEFEDVGPILRGIGFDEGGFYMPLAQLSAGQRSRALLARALAQPAEILLLDEPTNHLDARARSWLEHFLLRQNRTCLFVSHDETFLESITTRVFELRRGQFLEFSLGYADYLKNAAALLDRHWSEYESEQRQLVALEKAAEQRDALSAKVAKAPPGARYSRDFYRRKAAKVARTGRLLRERLAPEARVRKPWEEQPIPTLHFSNCARTGDTPIQIEQLTVGYGAEPVIRDLNLIIRRCERLAIRGFNGSGKTTLLRALLGELKPDRGSIRFGANVKLGYFAQEAETLDPQETPLEACLHDSTDRAWIRTLLACLKLPRDLAEARIGKLSLGERAKTALTKVLVSGANVLLLDEPTNHLEIEARHALVETLIQFPGTILFVSHDPAFVEAVAIDSVELSPPVPVPRSHR